MGIDHVNPKSWKGNVCVGDVNLKQQWDKGRKKAENILQKLEEKALNIAEKVIDTYRKKNDIPGTESLLEMMEAEEQQKRDR